MRVVIADDALLFRRGLATLLVDAGLDVVAETVDADTLLEAVATHRPDVAIVDIRMPPTHTTEGLAAARRIRDEHPSVGVLVLSAHLETADALRLLGGGADGLGYLLKDRVDDLDEFLDALRRVAVGRSALDPEVVERLVHRREVSDTLEGLSAREREVLGLMAEGRSNVAIAQRLFVSDRTVESHVSTIFTKLGLLSAADDHRRVLAVLRYLRSTTV